MNGTTDILEHGVTHNPCGPEIRIDLDIANMSSKTTLGTGGVYLGAFSDRATRIISPCSELFESEGRELAGISTGGARFTIFPSKDSLTMKFPILGLT